MPTRPALASPDLLALARGEHGDPFAHLGPHRAATGWTVRTVQPEADAVWFVPTGGRPRPMPRAAEGVFAITMADEPREYRLRVSDRAGVHMIQDPYRFPAAVTATDEYYLGEGNHRELHAVLGARPDTALGVAGVRFAVWAPNARRVSVVGGFNRWDGRAHPMRRHPSSGIWEIFVPEIGAGELYKFELIGPDGHLLPLKSDPWARRCELAPGTACIVHESRHVWADEEWMRRRPYDVDAPMSVYEVHAGSWRRDETGAPLSYTDLAEHLVPYVRDMGFTHVELMPMTEYPFEGSWGYQPIGLFAPTARHGAPDDFRALVDTFHDAGIGVILDWVPAHFPRDEHGLVRFDGTQLYEHADARRADHPDWGTLAFNYGRAEVGNYLLSSALFWINEFHLDALRVDAVASMLYLDYSRKEGEWIPNRHGGNEDLEAVDLLRRINTAVHAAGGRTIAEESTAWPAVSRPVDHGGLGFSQKWNMGWMNDTLSYMSEDPVHRVHHQSALTFSLLYAWDENFILPLSHDEVVHGKGSLLGRMPGDEWQRFANLRAYYGYMFAHPGKKLLFMGAEVAPYQEWSHERGVEWHLLEYPVHSGVQTLVRDLNRLHREHPALGHRDTDPAGFAWSSCDDAAASVIAMLRFGRDPLDVVIAVSNFTPVPRHAYRVGVPAAGLWRELLNTDAECYSGSGTGNGGSVETDDLPVGGFDHSLALTVPPLATIYLEHQRNNGGPDDGHA